MTFATVHLSSSFTPVTRGGAAFLAADSMSPHGTRTDPQPGAAACVSPLAGKRAVIVEDEGVTQLQLRRALSKMAIQVVGVANTGEGGVQVALRERPDIVMMDIRMPGGIDGLEAASQILSEYRPCIVFITAFALSDYQRRAQELGAAGYILKPVVSESLASDLEKAFTSHSAS